MPVLDKLGVQVDHENVESVDSNHLETHDKACDLLGDFLLNEFVVFLVDI